MGKKRPAGECEGSNTQDVDVGNSEGATRSQSGYNEWPGGVKAAKQDNMQEKMRDGALYARAEATRSMAAIQMKNVRLIEDQNMLLLMTMPIEESVGEDAHEYLRLRRGEELKKLKKRLSVEESALQTEEAREVERSDMLGRQEDAPGRDRGGTSVDEAVRWSGDRGAPRTASRPSASASAAASKLRAGAADRLPMPATGE